MIALQPLDYLAVALYLLIVIIVCVRVTKRNPDADELFLAGRSLGAGVIGLSTAWALRSPATCALASSGCRCSLRTSPRPR